MRYERKHPVFLVVLLMFVAILDYWSRSYFPPNLPRWFDLAFTVLFLSSFLYFLYNWIQMRKYYKTEGIDVPAKTKNKDAIFEMVYVILPLCAGIVRFSDFLGKSNF
ncbi:hypothetical protein [Clostridium merdae]|uniref:hypothetical protein n=1 Tax=Clostridium merdae TaxID=1958780 RepID=UPI000A26AF02|nr:hypothetical protein [Clostridium merdae]